MKAVIKIATARSQFTQDQIAIMRRVANVLIEHDLSIEITMKVKEKQVLPFKTNEEFSKEKKISRSRLKAV